ncbi:MAG: amidohydrolase family protein, partial [Methanosarcinales archaeon]
MIDLSKIPIIDNHCHPLLEKEENIAERFSSFFTEGKNSLYVKDSMLYVHTIKDLCSLLGCEETPEAVLESRSSFSREDYIKTLFKDANIDTLLIDTGYPHDALSIDQLRTLIPCKIKEILRIETLLETLIMNSNTFYELESKYTQILHNAVHNKDIVAFKSIIAYRSGLEIKDFRREEAEKAFQSIKNQQKIRLESKPLLDYFIKLGLRISAEHDLPFQIHTGFGDPDINLLEGNPLLLLQIFQDNEKTNIVLLHGGYPYLREAGYLASIYPNVFVDLSLMIPFAQHGMVNGILSIMELAPYSKVLYGSDGFSIP